MKRNYRITVCATQEEWDAIHWLAFLDGQTPATTAYLLMQDSLVKRIDPATTEGRNWIKHSGKVKIAAYQAAKEVR